MTGEICGFTHSLDTPEPCYTLVTSAHPCNDQTGRRRTILELELWDADPPSVGSMVLLTIPPSLTNPVVAPEENVAGPGDAHCNFCNGPMPCYCAVSVPQDEEEGLTAEGARAEAARDASRR